MLLKVCLIFCFIFTDAQVYKNLNEYTDDELHELTWDPRINLYGSSFGNAGSMALQPGPDEKIKQYGYYKLTESTNIAALGSFQIDIGNSTHRSTSQICLYSKKTINDEKLYEGHFCASHLYAAGEEAKAHIKATLVIPPNGNSTLQIYFHSIQYHIPDDTVMVLTNVTSFAISNKSGDFECTGKTSECDWDIQ